MISIHAPLAGRDDLLVVVLWIDQQFQSTRPSRGATERFIRIATPRVFQSTRPSRGATLKLSVTVYRFNFNPRAPRGARRTSTMGLPSYGHFNPRAPRGARPCILSSLHIGRIISIHAPLAGRDDISRFAGTIAPVFQSTRPSRGATTAGATSGKVQQISIHAPLAGRDCRKSSRSTS